MSICAVILAGGSGTRLWPLSRAAYPKQFLTLQENHSLLQESVLRLSGLDINSTITVCNEEHRFFVAEQLKEIGKLDSIILEPYSRNTAPAIALAALSVANDPLLFISPADHVIHDRLKFTELVSEALPMANAGKIITFGIVPSEPNTGYGYIKKGEQSGPGFVVQEFIEKPSFEKAEEYIASNDYFWNSGMFLFRASRYLEELQKHNEEIYIHCKAAMEESEQDLNFLRVGQEAFAKSPSQSIDYAIMEKTEDAVVMPMPIYWNDIGSWSSLWDISHKDGHGNMIKGDVITHDSTNSYIHSENQFLSTIGVDNLVVVTTKDAVLVANKDSIQNVKETVNYLRQEERTEWNFHREVFRPWGKYESIDQGDNYQVKRITVNPGAKLSDQLHNHRSEHWVVVNGKAKVRNGDNIFELTENESTFIPVGTIHSLENIGESDLEIIEVQTGSYLGEDDIIRFADRYGRITK
jgi:mannose-1-phosphate guanylyltransferase